MSYLHGHDVIRVAKNHNSREVNNMCLLADLNGENEKTR